MKIAWVHSMRFQRKGDDYFSEAMVSYEVWKRYLRHFDSLLVVGREAEIDSAMHHKYITLTSGSGVQFELSTSINSGMDLLLNGLGVKRRLRDLFASVDGVIARLPSEHGLAAISVARELKKPFAIELVGCAFDALWNHGDVRGKLYAPILSWRVRKAVRGAPFVLYVTREFLQRRYPSSQRRASVSNAEIPCTVAAISDVETPVGNAFGDSRPNLASKSGQLPALIVGLVGAMQNAYKGQETAFRALREARRQGIDVKLRLLGSGNTLRWKSIAEKIGVHCDVAFDGLLPPGEPVFRWMRDLDLYIQPSLTEGLPRALIEAMSCGKPALASSAGGMPELLEPQCLHRPGDWGTLASQIVVAAREPAWRLNQGRRNKEAAAAYSGTVLDAKRAEFWSAFARYCEARVTSVSA